MIPSFVVASLVKPGACSGCQECARWCSRAGALTFAADGQVVINESLCRGCGMCIEHCPTKALGFVPRQVFYDVLTKTVRPLGKGTINL